MIAEVDAALRGLFDPLLPAGAAVRFGPPPPDGKRDVLNLFLAEVREDTAGLAADWDDVRDGRGALLARRPPVRRFDLCYLVTAWTADERRRGELLDAVLLGVAPDRRIAPALLGQDPDDPGPPVLIRFADAVAGLHHSLGLPAQTVIGLVVNAPLVRPLDTDLGGRAEKITVTMDPGARRRPPARTLGPPRTDGAWRAARVDEEGAG